MSAIVNVQSRTRFPPEPNGRLHIGHLKAMIADFEGLPQHRTGVPICNLRYDDTNPTVETEEYRKGILEDLTWLGFKPDRITSTSDYFDELYKFMIYLLENEHAFFEWDTDIGKQRACGIASHTRHVSDLKYLDPAAHGDRGMACIRIKISPDHKMSAMRDPVIYRYKTSDGKSGWFPTYDFSHPIVDFIEGITHSYCTREFFIRRELYYWFIRVFCSYPGSMKYSQHVVPEVYEFNRLELEGIRLSKRYMLQEIKDGHVTGFDDPKLYTIAGLRNKGHSPKALLHFCRNYVDYVPGDGGTIPIHKFEHALREYYETNATRRFGIPVSECLNVKLDADTDTDTVLDVVRPNHPDHPEHGMRHIKLRNEVVINRSDFNPDGNKKYKRIKCNGNKVYLKYAVCVSYKSHQYEPNELTVQVHKDGKGGAAIQWLDKIDMITLVETTSDQTWNCEGDIMEHDIVQLERCGFFKIRQNGTMTHLLDLKSSYSD